MHEQWFFFQIERASTIFWSSPKNLDFLAWRLPLPEYTSPISSWGNFNVPHSLATLSFCTPHTLPFLSNATSLCSLAVSFSLHALAPQVLPSHSNPNLMHISSFGSSIAASSPKIGVYKGTCCGSFCLSVCAFHVILMRVSCKETVLLISGKVRLAKVLSG